MFDSQLRHRRLRRATTRRRRLAAARRRPYVFGYRCGGEGTGAVSCSGLILSENGRPLRAGAGFWGKWLADRPDGAAGKWTGARRCKGVACD